MSEHNNQNQQNAQAEPSLSELLQIRRDKLSALQAAGKDPFQVNKYDVTHHSNEVEDNFEAMEVQAVRLAGHLMCKLGLGQAMFADLRDSGACLQS